jgi:hypothetical protein
LVKHTFHRLVKVTLLLRLLSANCQPGFLPPIHLSSLPWLVVALPLVAPHPPPPVVFTARRLILLSSCPGTSTSHCFEVPPAFKTPPPLVRWCLRLIVTMPLIVPLPLLVLLMIHHLLSANAFPPIGLLFASWLSCHPCCRAAAASCPLDMSPPPLVLLTRRLHFKTSHATASCLLAPLLSFAFFFRLVLTSHLVTPPLQVSMLESQLHSHRLVVVSHLVALLPPTVLSSTPPLLDALVTHLPFASCMP